MRRRRIRWSVWEILLPLVVLAVGLVLTVGQFTPQGRVFMRAAGHFFRPALVVLALGGLLAGVVWLIRRRQDRRVPAPAEVGPEARVVDFPPPADVMPDLEQRPQYRPKYQIKYPPEYQPEYQPRVVEVAAPRPPPGPSRPAVPTTGELVERLRGLDGVQFEPVMATVYEGLGYVVSRGGGAPPEGGIDLVIEKLGQRTAVQCPQGQARPAGVQNVREFLGALTRAGIHHGIFIALAGATAEAGALAGAHDINILTDADLAQLLDRAGARFNPAILAALHA